MKKLGLCLLLVVMLSGCSGEPEEISRGMELRTKLLDASEFSFDTEVTADYGDKLHAFSMNCRADEKGNVAFVVTAPETIAGISGTVTDAGGTLTFDDTALYFELLADGQLSPVSAPWILVRTLRSGYLTSACMDETDLLLTMDDSYEDDAMTLDIWLDDRDLPARAELLYGGRRILSLSVTNAVLL